MKLLTLFVIIFLLMGAIIIALNSDLSLSSGKKSFIVSFLSWILDLGRNTVNVVGYVIHQDWLPEPKLNQTENQVTYTIYDKTPLKTKSDCY